MFEVGKGGRRGKGAGRRRGSGLAVGGSLPVDIRMSAGRLSTGRIGWTKGKTYGSACSCEGVVRKSRYCQVCHEVACRSQAAEEAVSSCRTSRDWAMGTRAWVNCDKWEDDAAQANDPAHATL